MKYKTSELAGVLLDAAVAQAEQVPIEAIRAGSCIAGLTPNRYVYSPSTIWQQGGPIIDRGRMHVAPLFDDQRWRASMEFSRTGVDGTVTEVGDTPLEAAMRAYVSAKIGQEVELP